MVKNGCDQSVHGTLKLAKSEKRRDGINGFFACWYKFKKTKLWVSDFWVGTVRNTHDLLVHEALKSAYCKNEFTSLANFLNGDSDVIIFG